MTDTTKAAAALNAETIVALQAALRKAEGKSARLAAVLNECREYLNDRADADTVGDPPRVVPNAAMRLVARIERVLEATS